MYLMNFEFGVEHVPGKDSELPDALSRFPGNEDWPAILVQPKLCARSDVSIIGLTSGAASENTSGHAKSAA